MLYVVDTCFVITPARKVRRSSHPLFAPAVVVVWICVDDGRIQRNVHLLFDEPLVLGFAFLDKIILLEQFLERD